MLHRHFEIVIEGLVRIDRVPAHLQDFAHLDLGAVEVGIEQRQTVGRLLAFLDRHGARQQHDLVGLLRGRGPDLLAVDDVMVAFQHRLGLDLRGVEAGIGLGDAEAGARRAVDDRGQPLLLLLVGAVLDDRMQPENVDVDGRAGREGAGRMRDLLHHDRGLGDAEARAAIFLRHRNAEPAAIGDGLGEFEREGMGLVLLQPVIVVEPVADRADGVADFAPFRRVAESVERLHASSLRLLAFALRGCASSSRARAALHRYARRDWARGGGSTAGVLREFDREARDLELPLGRMLDLREHLHRLQMRILEQILDPVDGMRRNIGRAQSRDPFRRGLLRQTFACR